MNRSYTIYRWGGKTLGAFQGVSPMDAVRKGISVDRDQPIKYMPKLVAFRGCEPVMYAADDNPNALYYAVPFDTEQDGINVSASGVMAQA